MQRAAAAKPPPLDGGDDDADDIAPLAATRPSMTTEAERGSLTTADAAVNHATPPSLLDGPASSATAAPLLLADELLAAASTAAPARPALSRRQAFALCLGMGACGALWSPLSTFGRRGDRGVADAYAAAFLFQLGQLVSALSVCLNAGALTRTGVLGPLRALDVTAAARGAACGVVVGLGYSTRASRRRDRGYFPVVEAPNPHATRHLNRRGTARTSRRRRAARCPRPWRSASSHATRSSRCSSTSSCGARSTPRPAARGCCCRRA